MDKESARTLAQVCEAGNVKGSWRAQGPPAPLPSRLLWETVPPSADNFGGSQILKNSRGSEPPAWQALI